MYAHTVHLSVASSANRSWSVVEQSEALVGVVRAARVAGEPGAHVEAELVQPRHPRVVHRLDQLPVPDQVPVLGEQPSLRRLVEVPRSPWPTSMTCRTGSPRPGWRRAPRRSRRRAAACARRVSAPRTRTNRWCTSAFRGRGRRRNSAPGCGMRPSRCRRHHLRRTGCRASRRCRAARVAPIRVHPSPQSFPPQPHAAAAADDDGGGVGEAKIHGVTPSASVRNRSNWARASRRKRRHPPSRPWRRTPGGSVPAASSTSRLRSSRPT
jgi:hypothetical protein